MAKKVDDLTRYELHWKCIPMDAIASHEDWYTPYLGQGVYMLVAATTSGGYIGYYVGQSTDIGRRWCEHVKHWFESPDEGVWIPNSADDFLADPAGVFNGKRMAQGLENRFTTQKQILRATWFCFAEVNGLRPGHTLENVEYVLQEGLKAHVKIRRAGWIGDTGRGRPQGDLQVSNHFGRQFLEATLPSTIRFPDDDATQVA